MDDTSAPLLSVDQAIAILDAVPLRPTHVQLPLMDAVGLRVAEEVFADRDYPPFDKAVMDGYAIRASDSRRGGVRLTVIQTIAAGQVGRRGIEQGEAIKIMTGAPLPAGADAVVPIEQTSRDADHVICNTPITPGNALARQGSDTHAGRLLLEKGTKLGPAQIAVAATVGKSTIWVYAAPVVALLTTGDEIIELDRLPTGSKIRNSNGPMMTTLLRQLGCRVVDLGIARDNPTEIRSAIEKSLQSDALFITGGMSMGERDYVPMLLREMGMELKIAKLRIKPGKPFVFATRDRVDANPMLVFGLPGNPVSAFVCTIRLAARIVSRLSGAESKHRIRHTQLTKDLPANGPREYYLPAFKKDDSVEPLNPNGSADLFTLARANALIIRPENAPAANAGDLVTILSFR